MKIENAKGTLVVKIQRLAAQAKKQLEIMGAMGFKSVEKWIVAGKILGELREAVLENGDNWQKKVKLLCGWNPSHASKVISIGANPKKVLEYAKSHPFPTIRDAYLASKGMQPGRWDKKVAADQRLRKAPAGGRVGGRKRRGYRPGELPPVVQPDEPPTDRPVALPGVVVQPNVPPSVVQPQDLLEKLDGLSALDIATIAMEEGMQDVDPIRLRRVVRRLFELAKIA
jgi:hypothetical protein